VNDIFRNIWTGLAAATPLDQVNLVLGVAGVWLMIRRSLWAFPVGLVAVTVQGVLFFRTRIYADALLQVFFFVTLAWGWWHWVKHRGKRAELPVTKLGASGRVIVIVAASITTVAWALALRRWTDAVIPWRDAAFSVVAQVLQARKQVETWPLWVIVNMVAIPAYWSASLAYSAFLYLIYLGLALAGWRAWHRAIKSVPAHG
jgi:nicotinamide mononucleotide transporter